MQEDLLKSSVMMDNLTALSKIQSNILMNNEYQLKESMVIEISEFLQRNIDNGAFDAVPKMEHALNLIFDIIHTIITNKNHDCTVLDNKLLLECFIDILKLSSDATTASFSSFLSHKCYESILNIINDVGLLNNIIKHKLLQSFVENIANAIKSDKTSTITQSLAVEVLCKIWPLLDADQIKLSSNFIPANLKNGLNKYSDYEGTKLPIFIRRQINSLNDENPDIHSFQFKSIYLNIVPNNVDDDNDDIKRVIYENIWVDFEEAIVFQFDNLKFRIDYKDIISVKNKDKTVMSIQLQYISDNIKSLLNMSELPNQSQSLYICFEATKSKSKLLETVISRVNANVLKAHTDNESTKYSSSFSRLYIDSQVDAVHTVNYDVEEFDIPLYQPDSPQTSVTASKSSVDQQQLDSPKTYPQDALGDRFESALSSKASSPSSKSMKSLLKSQIITKKVVPKKANMQLDSVAFQNDGDDISDTISKSPTTRSSTKKLSLSSKNVKSKAVIKAKQEPKLSKLITKSSTSAKVTKDLNNGAKKSSERNGDFVSLAPIPVNELPTTPKRRSYKASKLTTQVVKEKVVVQQPSSKPSNKFKPKMRSLLTMPTKRNDYLSEDDIQVTGETPEKIVKPSAVSSKISLLPTNIAEPVPVNSVIISHASESIIKSNGNDDDYAPDYDYGHYEDNNNIPILDDEVTMKDNAKESIEKPRRKFDNIKTNAGREETFIDQSSVASVKTSSLLQKANGAKVQISDEARHKADNLMLSFNQDESDDDISERSDAKNNSSTITTSAITLAAAVNTKTPEVNIDVRKNKQRGQQLTIETKKKVEIDNTVEVPSNVSIAFNDDYERLFARPKVPRLITNTVTPKSINAAKSTYVPSNPTPLRNTKKLKQTSPSTDDISSDYSISDSELDSDDDIAQQKYEIIAQFNQMRKEKIYKKARKEMDDIESVAFDQIGSYLSQWIEIIKNSKVEFARYFKNDEYVRTIKIHNNFTEKVNNDIPQLQSQQKENHDVFLNLMERFDQLAQVIANDLKQFERDKNDLQLELSNKKKQIDKKTSVSKKQKIPSDEKAELFKKALGF